MPAGSRAGSAGLSHEPPSDRDLLVPRLIERFQQPVRWPGCFVARPRRPEARAPDARRAAADDSASGPAAMRNGSPTASLVCFGRPRRPGAPMNISITFRHMDSSDAIKRYADDKLAKLQSFLRQPMSGKVTLAIDKLRHVVEARISSGGEHLEATRRQRRHVRRDRSRDGQARTADPRLEGRRTDEAAGAARAFATVPCCSRRATALGSPPSGGVRSPRSDPPSRADDRSRSPPSDEESCDSPTS